MSLADNHGVSLINMTVTLPHVHGEKLKPKIALLKKAMTRAQIGGSVRQLRAHGGFLGLLHVIEVTYGSNGWHPHAHVILFFSTRAAAEPGASKLAAAISRAIVPDAESHPAQVVQYKRENNPSRVAPYFAKDLRQGSQSPFLLLRSAICGDNPASDKALHLWLDFVEAMRGAHQGVISRRLRDAIGAHVNEEKNATSEIQVEVAPAREFVFLGSSRCEAPTRVGGSCLQPALKLNTRCRFHALPHARK